MDTSVLLAVTACVLLTILLRWFSRKRRQPPGPMGLPIVGYLPFMSLKAYLDFNRLAKKYGNVFSIQLGSVYTVILNDFESTKEAFFQDAFMGRPPDTPFEQNKETLETEAFNGLPWVEHRKLSLHLLKDLGYGKSKIEEHMKEEIRDLLKLIDERVNVPFCAHKVLAPSVSNNICSLLFGKRLRYDDPVAKMRMKMLRDMSLVIGKVIWQMFFPWLRKICKFLGIFNADIMAKLFEEFRTDVKKEIEEHEKTLNPDNIRDFIDGYLIEIEKRKDDPTFCKPFLQDLVATFFQAGTDPVQITLDWLLLTAAAHPDAQSRIQREIDDVVGRSQLPNAMNRSSMPYTQAFIMEVMRWRTMIPVNFMRYTVADGQVKGYFIPKGTCVMSNFWAIHHDPDYWGPDADEFRPERFLTEDGQAVSKKERFMPLSIGKRSCPGEPHAKAATFLYLTSILQKFNIRLPDGKVADFDGLIEIGLIPKPQELIFTRRS